MHQRIVLGAAQAVLGIVLGVCLYVYSATASIPDEYAPGIAAFRLRMHPLFLIACFVVLPMVVALVSPAAWRNARHVTDRLAFTAFAVSIVFLIAVVAAQAAGVQCAMAPPAPPRELVIMLRHSLGCPEFSAWSYAAPLLTASISLACVFVSRRPQSDGRERENW